MAHGKTLDYRDVLEDLELHIDLRAEHAKLLRFKVDACRLMELSSTACVALDAATRYLQGSASDRDLERARVACWESIAAHDSDTRDQEVASTRAVICTLYPSSWPDDLFNGLAIFGEFAVCAGVDAVDLAEMLRATFAELDVGCSDHLAD